MTPQDFRLAERAVPALERIAAALELMVPAERDSTAYANGIADVILLLRAEGTPDADRLASVPEELVALDSPTGRYLAGRLASDAD